MRLEGGVQIPRPSSFETISLKTFREIPLDEELR